MSADGPTKRILVADDDLGILTMVGLYLRNAGYEVDYATDGCAAWALFQESAFDLVVLDRFMPKMSGDELAERIKEANAAMHLVLITGFIQRIPRPELFDSILVKPFSAAELVRSVEESLLG